MVGCFGLRDDPHPSHFPGDRILESVARVDVFWLNRVGALVAGTVTEVAIGTGGGSGQTSAGKVCRVVREGSGQTSAGKVCRVVRESPHVWIGETRVVVTWDAPMEGVERPWFLCACGRRVRYLYLRDTIRCARCFGLQHASRHLRRQTPGVGRTERLRRRLGNCELRPFAPLPTRIRRARGGRSRAYHEALVSRILDEEEQLLGHLKGVTRDLDRRIEVRKARGEW